MKPRMLQMTTTTTTAAAAAAAAAATTVTTTTTTTAMHLHNYYPTILNYIVRCKLQD